MAAHKRKLHLRKIRPKLASEDRRIVKEFGKRVRALREKKGLSVYDVTGDDMPIRSRQHWQAIESGQKNINLTTVFKIAKSLGIGAEALIEKVSS